MHLGGPGLAQHLDERALRVTAHDRVVDDDQALAFDDLAQRVELEADAQLAQGLRGLDERAAHVGVLHEALGEGDPGLLRVADRGGRTRVGRGDHQVGLDGVFARQGGTHLVARGHDAAPADGRVGAGQVDVLEDAGVGAAHGEAARVHARRVDRDELAGLDLAHKGRATQVQGGGLGGDDPAGGQAAQHERAVAVRVARGVQRVLVHEDQGERALDARQDLQGGADEGRGLKVVSNRRGRGDLVRTRVPGRHGRGRDEGGRPRDAVGHAQQRGHEGGVGGGTAFEVLAVVGDLGGQLAQLDRVGEVAVVGQGERARGGGAQRRLGVAPHVRAGRRVADVAQGDVAAQALEGLLGEHLRDEALILVHEDLLAIRRRNTGALLAAVLQGVEGEVGQAGNILARGPYSEDPAVIVRVIVSEEFLVGQCHVWLRDGKHALTLPYFSPPRGIYPRCGEHTQAQQTRRTARNCARFAGQNRSLQCRDDTMECSNLEEETWPIRR